MKQRIILLQIFTETTGTIRCLVATVALGMGVQINDIDLIIHIGCPKSVVSYLQEAVWCSRDGRSGHSIVIYDYFTLSQKILQKKLQILFEMNKKYVWETKFWTVLTLWNRTRKQWRMFVVRDVEIWFVDELHAATALYVY